MRAPQIFRRRPAVYYIAELGRLAIICLALGVTLQLACAVAAIARSQP